MSTPLTHSDAETEIFERIKYTYNTGCTLESDFLRLRRVTEATYEIVLDLQDGMVLVVSKWDDPGATNLDNHSDYFDCFELSTKVLYSDDSRTITIDLNNMFVFDANTLRDAQIAFDKFVFCICDPGDI